jgi:hypothetical protein
MREGMNILEQLFPVCRYMLAQVAFGGLGKPGNLSIYPENNKTPNLSQQMVLLLIMGEKHIPLV